MSHIVMPDRAISESRVSKRQICIFMSFAHHICQFSKFPILPFLDPSINIGPRRPP